jgi:hypothetical protein
MPALTRPFRSYLDDLCRVYEGRPTEAAYRFDNHAKTIPTAIMASAITIQF